MDSYLFLADSLARHHIQDLVAEADDSRRTKQARRARTRRSARKTARARRG